MSSTPFGEHLKREREMRGVSLEEISAATRINTRFLEALEKAHWSDSARRRLQPRIHPLRGALSGPRRGRPDRRVFARRPKRRADAAHPAAEMPRDWKPLLMPLVVVLVAARSSSAAWFGLQDLSRPPRRARLRQALGRQLDCAPSGHEPPLSRPDAPAPALRRNPLAPNCARKSAPETPARSRSWLSAPAAPR